MHDTDVVEQMIGLHFDNNHHAAVSPREMKKWAAEARSSVFPRFLVMHGQDCVFPGYLAAEEQLAS